MESPPTSISVYKFDNLWNYHYHPIYNTMKEGLSCSACLTHTAEQVLVLCTELSGCAEQLWWESKMYLPPSVHPQPSWGKRQRSLSLHGSSAPTQFVSWSNQKVCLVLQYKSFLVLIFSHLKFCLLSPAHVWNHGMYHAKHFRLS